MEEEMILKMSLCSKEWFDKQDLNISDIEREDIRNLTKGSPRIGSVDLYPVIDTYAVFIVDKEISLSDDIYPSVLQMASLLKGMEGISKEVEVSLNGFETTETIRGAILEVLKLLIPQYNYIYREGRENL